MPGVAGSDQAGPADVLTARAAQRPPALRWLLIVAGILSLAIGVVGLLIPVFPTSPFVLVAAACFVRSSDRLHRWLLENRLFGEIVRRYQAGEGLPLATKVGALALLWAMLGTSALLLVPDRLWWAKVAALAVGLGMTIHVLLIRTRRRR